MNFLMMLATSSVRTLKTQTFTSNTSWTVPLNTSRLETASGFGARGTDGAYVQRYHKVTRIYAMRRGSGIVDTFTGQGDTIVGPMPNNYCDPVVPTPSDPVYENNQTCYEFYDASYSQPGATGTSASGFDRSFPGSTGNVQPATTSYTNVPATPGQSYQIIVPSGGSITITYYE